MLQSATNRGIVFGLLALWVVLLGGCSGSDEPVSTTLPPATTTTTTILSSTTTTSAVRETLPLEGVPPLAIYLAAIDRGLEGTRYEGDVYLDPESFIATGRLFCSLLGAGVEPQGVLESYITALEAESGELEDDDLVLGGVVLAASVEVICPDFSADLAALTPGRDGAAP